MRHPRASSTAPRVIDLSTGRCLTRRPFHLMNICYPKEDSDEIAPPAGPEPEDNQVRETTSESAPDNPGSPRLVSAVSAVLVTGERRCAMQQGQPA